MPTQAVTVRIAQAVVDELAAEGRFSQALSVERGYLPVEDLSRVTTPDGRPKLYVVPAAREVARQTRHSNERTYTVDVGVFRRVEWGDKEGFDALILLTEEIEAHFADWHALGAVEGATVEAVAADPVFSPELLEAHHLFAGVLRLTVKELDA